MASKGHTVENMKLIQTAFSELKYNPHKSFTPDWKNLILRSYHNDKENALMMVIEASKYSNDIHFHESINSVFHNNEYVVEIKF